MNSSCRGQQLGLHVVEGKYHKSAHWSTRDKYHRSWLEAYFMEPSERLCSVQETINGHLGLNLKDTCRQQTSVQRMWAPIWWVRFPGETPDPVDNHVLTLSDWLLEIWSKASLECDELFWLPCACYGGWILRGVLYRKQASTFCLF